MKSLHQCKFLILFIVLIGFTQTIASQDIQGTATYKSLQKVHFEMDSTNADSALEKQLKAMLKKQFQKTYILQFDREKSVYKEEESLDAPQAGGASIISSFSAGSDILFKNTKGNSFVSQKEFMGKVFLIEDSLPTKEWKLVNETKNIGEYTCFKATYTRTVQVPKKDSLSFSYIDDSEKEVEMVSKEIVTTAWYTPQIPISNGPGMYHGLPGLILEINDGSTTIVCTNIVLNPSKKFSINAPSKGKQVTQEAYDEIIAKKMKEMQEMHSPSGRDENSTTINIRIGG